MFCPSTARSVSDCAVPTRGPTVASGDGRAAEVWCIGLAKAVTIAIGRGENKGKTITYHNVARSWLKLTSTDGKTWSVPLDQIEGEGVNRAAVIVQGGTIEKPGLIFGAAMASIR